MTLFQHILILFPFNSEGRNKKKNLSLKSVYTSSCRSIYLKNNPGLAILQILYNF